MGIKASQAMANVPKEMKTDKIYDDYKKSKQKNFIKENMYNTETIPFKAVGIPNDAYTVGRIVGVPAPEFRKNGGDAKYVQEHHLVNDSGKIKLPVYFKLAKDDNGVTLNKLDWSWVFTRWLKGRDGIFASHLDKSKPKGEKITYHNETHPLFQKYMENRAYDNESYIRGAHKDPKEFVMFNWIDRMDKWCEENKHTKILVSSYYEGEPQDDKPGIVNFAPGVSLFGVHSQLKVLIETGNIYTTDIAVGKIKNTEGNYEYKVGAFSDSIVPPAVQALGKKGNLSDEELDYDLVDLNPILNESSYAYLLQNWGEDMKKWDKDFNTIFFEELQDAFGEETGEATKTQTTNEASMGDFVSEKSDEKEPKSPFNDDVAFDKSEEAKPEHSTETKTENSSEKEAFDFMVWKHFKELPNEQKLLLMEAIVGKDSAGNPIFSDDYQPGKKELLTCLNDSCTYTTDGKESAWPKDITVCPVCGEDLS